MRSPIRQTSLPRSLGVIEGHGPDSNASRAAATARLMSSRSLSGTRAMTEPSAGLNTSKALPEAAATQRPPIRLCLGFASHVPTFELTAGPEAWAEPWPLPFPLPAERAWRLDL